MVTPAEALTEWVSRQQPRSLLILGAEDHPLAAPLAERFSDTATTRLAPAADCLAGLGDAVFDVAVVLEALETLPGAKAGIVLGRLRDVHARRLMVMIRIGERWPGLVSHWQRNDLFAYGLFNYDRFETEGGPVHLYRFDLYDYKKVPDWLNARHWANPELWDKHRW